MHVALCKTARHRSVHPVDSKLRIRLSKRNLMIHKAVFQILSISLILASLKDDVS